MYSQAARIQFLKTKVCQDDPVLYRYYEEGNVEKFRKRLGDRDVSEAVQTLVTDATRDVILNTIKLLGKYMRPMGDLVVSGGEAFNIYLPRDDRIITTDIDTKFLPVFRIGYDTIITSRDPRFFEALQITKLLMWNKLGQLVVRLNAYIADRIRQIGETPIGKMLGIQPVKGQALSRRYTLIAKKKQGTTATVKEGDVLIDVELFALDCKIRYLGRQHTIGGILDIAYMRPSEIGYEVLYTRQRTKGVLVASKKFLVEDLYLLQSLKLRPKKAAKDRLRMYTFAKKVLKVPVQPGDSMKTIFFKCIPKVENTELANFVNRPYFDRTKLLRQALRVDPSKYPITPSRKKLPCSNPNGLPTQSQYAFDTRSKKWVSVTSTLYIRNQANFRGGKSCPSKSLYGYNPERNAAMSKTLVDKVKKL
jgi:hypothetical protein